MVVGDVRNVLRANGSWRRGRAGDLHADVVGRARYGSATPGRSPGGGRERSQPFADRDGEPLVVLGVRMVARVTREGDETPRVAAVDDRSRQHWRGSDTPRGTAGVSGRMPYHSTSWATCVIRTGPPWKCVADARLREAVSALRSRSPITAATERGAVRFRVSDRERSSTRSPSSAKHTTADRSPSTAAPCCAAKPARDGRVTTGSEAMASSASRKSSGETSPRCAGSCSTRSAVNEVRAATNCRRAASDTSYRLPTRTAARTHRTGPTCRPFGNARRVAGGPASRFTPTPCPEELPRRDVHLGALADVGKASFTC